jgi:predicted AAA+ superfamily ATPase
MFLSIFFILECFRLNRYSEKNYRVSYLRTKAGFEVDLILSKGREHIFVEVKSATTIDESEVTHLANTSEVSKIYYVSQDLVEIEISGVRCTNWKKFLAQVFGVF